MNFSFNASLAAQLKRSFNGLWKVRANLLIAAFCILAITGLDAFYTYFVNESYAFGWKSLSKNGYWLTCLLILIATFIGRIAFKLFFSLLFVFAVFQIMTFEYFGSYILPIHFIQLLPDFLLILSGLVEVLPEMVPVLIKTGIALVFGIVVLVTLSRHRTTLPRAGFLVLALIGGDLIGKYVFISVNREKLGEPSFKNLYPDTNNLGVYNSYKSASYLLVGILPDMMAGRIKTYPALPAPARLSSPDANIILILNESIRADSITMLGHELKTTPRLASFEGAYNSQIYSAGTMTRTSWAGLLNRLKYPGLGAQLVSHSNCLFRLAKENGFKTHFIYAQNRSVANTLLPFMCASNIDSILVRDGAAPNFQDFDASLLHHLRGIDLAERNFILIAPNGAHAPYGNKSPDSFKVFDDDYDNAVHYTDHVVADLVTYLQQNSSKPTYIIHTSDHGELLKGEDSRRGHGWFKGKVVRVPFFFLALNEPVEGGKLSEAKKVMSHFDLATLLIQLMGYEAEIEDQRNRTIFINGSDLSGLAGEMRLTIADGSLTGIEILNVPDDDAELTDISLPVLK